MTDICLLIFFFDLVWYLYYFFWLFKISQSVVCKNEREKMIAEKGWIGGFLLACHLIEEVAVMVLRPVIFIGSYLFCHFNRMEIIIFNCAIFHLCHENGRLRTYVQKWENVQKLMRLVGNTSTTDLVVRLKGYVAFNLKFKQCKD